MNIKRRRELYMCSVYDMNIILFQTASSFIEQLFRIRPLTFDSEFGEAFNSKWEGNKMSQLCCRGDICAFFFFFIVVNIVWTRALHTHHECSKKKLVGSVDFFIFLQIEKKSFLDASKGKKKKSQIRKKPKKKQTISASNLF